MKNKRIITALLLTALLMMLNSASIFATDIERSDFAEVFLSRYYIDKNENEQPSVSAVKDYIGNVLVEGTDFSVTYDDTPMAVGDHQIQVTGDEPYTFSKSISYTVFDKSYYQESESATGTRANVKYALDQDDGIMYVFGTDSMKDVDDNNYVSPRYCYVANYAPYLSGINTVVIDEGVQTVGRKAFANNYNQGTTTNYFPDLKSVYVPSTVTAIKENALTPSGGLDSVYIYSKDAVISNNAINTKNIYGFKGSTAETYAENHSSITFHEICENHTVTKVNAKDATCTEAGYSGDYVCSVCKEVLQSGSTINALNHDYQVDESTAVAATCTTPGKEADQKCSRCTSVITGAVIPAAHTMVQHDAKASTCTEQGNIAYSECSVCKSLFVPKQGGGYDEIELEDTKIPLAEHQYSGGWQVIQEPTCTRKGIKARYCDNCTYEDKADIDMLDHTWSDDYAVDTPADCIHEGSESRHCTVCGTTMPGTSRSIEKTGRHTYGAWKTTISASELAGGQKQRDCTVCGHKETASIAALAPTLPSVKISKPKAAKKAATVKWKKVSKKNLKKIKKVQIQYSLDGSFRSGVKTTTASAKKTSKKIKIPKGQKYYVRVRALTGNHVSKWSSVKSVKAK